MAQDYAAARQAVIEHAIKVYDIPAERIKAFQEVCTHSAQIWIEVEHVPAEVRQYEKDDQDWICATCGALIPPF